MKMEDLITVVIRNEMWAVSLGFRFLRGSADVSVVSLGGESKGVDGLVGVFRTRRNVNEHQRFGTSYQVVLKQLGQQGVPEGEKDEAMKMFVDYVERQFTSLKTKSTVLPKRHVTLILLDGFNDVSKDFETAVDLEGLFGSSA